SHEWTRGCPRSGDAREDRRDDAWAAAADALQRLSQEADSRRESGRSETSWHPIYDPVLRGLGAATVTVPPADLLTALETGIVDGFAWPAVAVTGPGYARAIKYKVSPPWWVGTDVALMNAKAFDSLSPELQKLLVDTMIEIENEVPDYFRA